MPNGFGGTKIIDLCMQITKSMKKICAKVSNKEGN